MKNSFCSLKSIVINDFISLFLKNKKNVFLYYFVILVISFTLYISDINNISLNTYYALLGLQFLGLNDIFLLLLFLFNLGFIAYITLYLFCNDLRYGPENIFLRIGMSKWYIYKIISIFLNISFLRIILHIGLSLILNICGNTLYIDLLCCLLIIVSTIILYVISTKNKLFPLIILLLIVCLMFLSSNILVTTIIKNVYIIIIFIIILIIICSKLVNIYKTNLFENM